MAPDDKQGKCMKNVLWMALLASVLSEGALAAEFPPTR